MGKDLREIQRFNVLGVGVCALNLDSALEIILEALEKKKKGYVCLGGVHGVSEAQRNPEYRRILNRAFLFTPDGMPLVWLGRRQFGKRVGRVYGPDLMLEVCRATQNAACRHFFYGGGPGTALTLAENLKARFPGLEIAGCFTPPFRPLNRAEEGDLLDKLEASRPEIIWVGLSTPKQEKFMARYIDRVNATLMFGVGAAFDFHSKKIRQAPRWIQRSGFEWGFRLVMEPRRLWRRYLINNPLFVFRIFFQITGLKKYPLSEDSAGKRK